MATVNILQVLHEENDIETLRKYALDFTYYAINAIEAGKVHEYILNNTGYSGVLPKYDKPMVSIVIPVYNKVLLTKVLLASILERTKNISYEVIIANDNSTDETNILDQAFKNVRIVNNLSGQRGFVYNVSNAIQYAKGEFIFLMNNDMIVCENYLSELLKVICKYDNVGIAGSKTISINNTIDECGIMVHNDGRVQFLFYDLPANTNDQYEYIGCDYCSGCSILFRKKSWELSGGFDKNLAPAYYEDSDFAFNLKYNFGLESVVVPKSKIVHFKRQTYTNNHDSKKNREYFMNKWKHVLSTRT